jgi:alpha-galactosidase
MCLCTPWADAFADELIRLHREVGVTVFKWDAVGLYNCDAPDHGHGDERHTPEQRRDRAAFMQAERFERIVERLVAACPEAIVDFDATEGGRFVGLGFLRYGRFFLINNGPYFSDFDIPKDHRREPETINVFFNPGPAHSRTMRTGLALDPYIPSHLAWGHLLPDGDARNQRHATATIALGSSAIWGDLLALSEEDVTRVGADVERYKRVAADVAEAYPRTFGFPGGSPEIHEKLDPSTGRGVVSFFTHGAGRFEHVTQPLAAHPGRVLGADEWRDLPDGRVWLRVELGREDARLVTFE